LTTRKDRGDNWDRDIPVKIDPALDRLSGETILCFGWTEWERSTQTWTQVLSRLAYRNRVLFVPPPLERRETLTATFHADVGRSGLRHIQDHLYVYHFPRRFPLIYKPFFLARVMEWLRTRALRKALRSLDCDRPILYILHPKFRKHIGLLKEKLVVYHVLDEYAEYLGANRELIDYEEKALIDSADLVICASRLLEATKKGENRNVYFVPNGVDFEHFSGQEGIPIRIPPDLRNIPRPRVGYLGRISDELDFNLLLEMARSMPGHSFCFAGHAMVVKRENRALFLEWSALSNVHLLGNKRTEELPDYVRAFDVAVMPYQISEGSLQRYPLKLHEYLAAGKPVVSVPMHCLEEFHDLVRIAPDEKTWYQAVTESIRDDQDQKQRDRQDAARLHDWNRVVIRIENLIQESMDLSD